MSRVNTTLAYVSPVSGQYYVFEFDALLGEDHDLGAEVSEHPVQEGVDIADHVRPKLATVDLRVCVSDTPINRVTVAAVGPGVLQGGQSTFDIYAFKTQQVQPLRVSNGYKPLTDPLTGLSLPTPGIRQPFVPPNAQPAEYQEVVDSYGRFNYLAFETPMGRTKAVFEILDALRTQGIPLELTTEIRHYPQMLLTGLRTSRDGTSTITLDLSLREFAFATTQQTEVKRRPKAKAKPVEVRARPQTPQGKAAPFKVTGQSSVAKKTGSLL